MYSKGLGAELLTHQKSAEHHSGFGFFLIAKFTNLTVKISEKVRSPNHLFQLKEIQFENSLTL